MLWNEEKLPSYGIQGWQCPICSLIYEASGFCLVVHVFDSDDHVAVEVAVKLKPVVPQLTDELVH